MAESLDKAKATPENIKNLRYSMCKGVHKYPKGTEPLPDPQVYRRDLLYNYIFSKPLKDLQEITELENFYNLLKGTYDDLIYKRMAKGKKIASAQEIAYLRLLKETLVDLNRLKYGEKRTNMNVGVTFSSIQEMMFGEPEKNGK